MPERKKKHRDIRDIRGQYMYLYQDPKISPRTSIRYTVPGTSELNFFL